MSDVSTVKFKADKRICVDPWYVHIDKSSEMLAAVSVSKQITVAGSVVLRFMKTFATHAKTTRALVVATLPPSATGATTEQAMTYGHEVFVRRTRCSKIIKAMSRFLHHAGLLQDMQSISIRPSVFASCLLRCFDVCGNPRFYGDSCHGSYRANPGLCGAAVTTATASKLVQVARMLDFSFTYERERCLAGSSMISNQYATSKHKSFSTRLQKFETVWHTWRYEHSVEIQKRVQVILFHLYDTGAILCKNMKQNESCCMRKPFLYSEARRYMKEVCVIEKKLLKSSGTSTSSMMLQIIKQTYCQLRGTGIFDGFSDDTTTPYVTTYRRHEKKSMCEMRRIVDDQRSSSRYSMDEIHHETVLDTSFHVKHSHLHRDDAGLLEATRFYKRGVNESLRSQIQGGDMHTGVPLYRLALQAVKDVREHLMELDIHTDGDIICKFLDETRLKTRIDNGSMTWKTVLRMLHVIVHGMQFCVGTEVSRTILYEERLRKIAATRTRGISSSTSKGSCANTEHFGLDRGMSKKRDLVRQNWQRMSLVIERRPMYEDSCMYAMDQENYLLLRSYLKNLKDAHLSHSTAQLGGLFCEAMSYLTAAMRKLDVSLTNADISATRMCSADYNIEVERMTFDCWFDHGLSTHNTLRWLRGSTVRDRGMSINGMVFDGYLSLIVGARSSELDDMEYPELLILDITYIQKARGTFLGQVAQATILVIICQRLTDMGLSGDVIKECVDKISTTSEFVDFGKPKTCRGQQCVQDDLHDALQHSLDRLSHTDKTHMKKNVIDVCKGILREVACETCHDGYPSSPVALSIARKWASATRMASPVMQGISTAFLSPEATHAAFSGDLHLPKAALHLSHGLYCSASELFRRVSFNVAVNQSRYNDLVRVL
jgi:hypothetical protein